MAQFNYENIGNPAFTLINLQNMEFLATEGLILPL